MATPTLSKVVGHALAGETEQSAMSTLDSIPMANGQFLSTNTLVSTTDLGEKNKAPSIAGTGSEQDQDVLQENQTNKEASPTTTEEEGSGLLSGARLYLCFTAFMFAIFVCFLLSKMFCSIERVSDDRDRCSRLVR